MWREWLATPVKSIFDIGDPVLRQVRGPEPERRLPAPSGGKTKLLDWLDKKKKDGGR